ncbi:MAG TPA: hypothetical protein VGC42_14220 [Kofleriaceae bacterium]
MWLLTTAWLAACGRLGFDASADGTGNHLPDAPTRVDATVAEPDAAPAGPRIYVSQMPTEMNAECGMPGPAYPIMLGNRGDQDLVITGGEVGPAQVRVAGNERERLPAAGSGSSGSDMYQVLTAFPITIPAGGTSVIRIKTPDSVTGTDLARSTKTATLMLATNAADSEAFPIELVTTVTGANLGVTIVGGGGADGRTMNFTGASAGMCPAPRSLKVSNTGNLGVQATISPRSGSGVGAAYASGFTSGAVEAGQTQTATWRPFTTGQCSVHGGQLVIASPSSGVCTTEVTVTVNFDMMAASSASSCNCP